MTNLTQDIAFVLHEQWRETRKKEDGSYEPRWKKIKGANFVASLDEKDLPSYLRKSVDGYEIDIANAGYTQLSPDWQQENKAAAEVVAKIIEAGKELSRNEIGDIIHNAWLERNPWAKDGELGVPFAQLSKEEQNKDIAQYEIALTMSKAELETTYIRKLEDVANFLVQAKKLGRNIVYNFNGHTLFSEFDTPDTCFLKVCGKTIEQRRVAEEKRRKESELEELKLSAEAKAKIPTWNERGERLIYPENTQEWHKCVESRANDLYYGMELDNALDVMDALEQGKSVKEATEIAESMGHSGMSWNMMMKIVLHFSKRGPEFFRANVNDISAETEQYLQKVEAQNKLYESMSKAKARHLAD